MVPDTPLRLITASSLSSTVLLLYEFLITFERELEFIWPKPNNLLVKWLYLFIRYFSILSQISMQLLIRLDTIPFTTRLRSCKAHLLWPLVVCQCILTSVELVLVWRVQALYPHRPLYAALGLFVFAEMITLGVNGIVLVPRLSFNSVCEASVPIGPILVYGAIAMSSQSAIFVLAVRKRVKLGWNRAPIVSLIIRDGALAYFIVFVLQIMTMVSLTTGRFGYMQYWLMAMLSAVGCRIIINLQRVKISDHRTLPRSMRFELTTRITDSRYQEAMPETPGTSIHESGFTSESPIASGSGSGSRA